MSFVREYYFWGYIGFLAGCMLMLRNHVKAGISFPLAVAGVTAAIYGGLWGTRILHILSYDARLLLTNPGQAFVFWQGGLAWLGGPFLGTALYAVVMRIARKPVWENAGSVAPGLALAHALSRIGCLLRGCCYGAPTTLPWAIHSDALGTRVHATQIYSMVCELAVFALLQSLWRKPANRKYLLPLYGLLLASHRFVTEWFRGGPAGPELIEGLRFFHVVCIVMFALSAAILALLWNRKRGAAAACVIALATIAVFVVFKPRAEAARTRSRHGEGKHCLVVTRSMFVDGLQRWVALRERQGFKVTVGQWDDSPTPEAIRQWIAKNAEGTCTHILLVGDCAAEFQDVMPWHLPSVEVAARGVGDALYGDLDGDRLPDVPVGRLPVRDEGGLDAELARIERHENRELAPSWFRAVVWAGADNMHEPVRQMVRRIDALLPDWMDAFVMTGLPDCVYTGRVLDQPFTFLDEISRPAMLSVIVSHGSYQSVRPAENQGNPVFLCTDDVVRLESAEPGGPLFILGCESGSFDLPGGKGPSLAEAFVRRPGGPIGVVAATCIMDPVTNCLAVEALSDALGDSPATVGGLMLAMQRAVCAEGQGTLEEIASRHDVAAKILASTADAKRKASHKPGAVAEDMLCYTLLGDPACRLYAPKPLPVAASVSPDGWLEVSGTAPDGCRQLHADLLFPKPAPEDLPEFTTDSERSRAFLEANRRPVAAIARPAPPGAWDIRIPPPPGHTLDEGRLRLLGFGPGGPYVVVQEAAAPTE